MKTISRHQAREAAFLFLFGNFLETPDNDNAQHDFEAFCKYFNHPADSYSWELVDGTRKNLPTLNQKIIEISKHWKLERMNTVDLTILRIATYEILFCVDVPKTVAINEAIELAKSYGSEESPSFVNGILDKFEKPS